MKIKDILVPGLKTISAEASMADAEKILQEARIRHLPVSNGRDIVGLISDRDIQRARTVIKSEDKVQTHIQSYKKVTDYMSSPVLKMKITDTVENLTREMIRLKVSSFIIEDQNASPVGIITTEDLLLVLLDRMDTSGPLKGVKKFIQGFIN